MFYNVCVHGLCCELNNNLNRCKMNKEQELQAEEYYQELKNNKTITTLNEALVFKLAYEKALIMHDVGICADVSKGIYGVITKTAFTTPNNHGVVEVQLPYSYYKMDHWRKGDKIELKH